RASWPTSCRAQWSNAGPWEGPAPPAMGSDGEAVYARRGSRDLAPRSAGRHRRQDLLVGRVGTADDDHRGRGGHALTRGQIVLALAQARQKAAVDADRLVVRQQARLLAQRRQARRRDAEAEAAHHGEPGWIEDHTQGRAAVVGQQLEPLA